MFTMQLVYVVYLFFVDHARHIKKLYFRVGQ